MNSARKKIIFDITLIAVLTAILSVQEFLLTFLPNMQFTVILIVLYAKILGTKRTLIIIVIHVILDNLLLGSFNIIYFPTMLIGWSLVPILLNTIFKKVTSPFGLACLSVIFSLVYCWLFIIPSVIISKVDFIPYLISDIPFELILASCSFITVYWLYEPLSKVMNNLTNKYVN